MNCSFTSLTRAACVALALGAADPAPAGETFTDGVLVIDTPWARASIGAGRPGVAYMTIRNTGMIGDTLVAVETSVSDRPEIHMSAMHDGVATMAPAGPVAIPAGGEVRLEPGGLHVMLMMLHRPLVRGESFPMTLILERAGRIDITVPVYSPGATEPEG